MDQYLIDTDTCIFFLKNQYQLKEKVREVGIHNCYLSEITVAELTYGAYRSQRLEKHLQEVEEVDQRLSHRI
jgi:tRNA(fMet)-specific endonuclease VapC